MTLNDLRWDLKYRPQRFDQVLGNKGPVRNLLVRSQTGTLGESYLFGGPKGCGKTSMARLVIRAMRCTGLVEGEPCNTCESCLALLAEAHDAVEEMDSASQGSVDRIREMVREADYSTMDGGRQVYVLDEAQRLTQPAQDALLKSVEDRIFLVILCTTDPGKIRPALRSRLEEYNISPPTVDVVTAWLERICKTENVDFDPQALLIIAKMSDCCPRISIRALEKLHLLGPVSLEATRQHFRFSSYELVDKILSELDPNPARAFSLLDELAVSESPTWIRDTIVLAISNGLRIDIGAKPNFPVPIRFFQNRMSGWVSLAKELGSIDKPSLADIEASLLSGPGNRSPGPTPVAGSTSIPAPVPQTPIPVSSNPPPPAASTNVTPPVPVAPAPAPPSPAPRPSSPPVKSAPASITGNGKPIEVDGVKYHPNERLTTLDDKITASQGPESAQKNGSSGPSVESDQAHVPITEKEFVRGLISRVRG